MKNPLPFVALALCLVLALAGCGDDSATSSKSEGSGASTTADSGDNARSEPPPRPGTLNTTKPLKVVIGDFEAEGPFSAISDRGENRKPRFIPSGQPASKKTISRELEVGSGPAAQRGDEVSIYYVGADQATGKIQYYGWPPQPPGAFQLGYSAFGRTWEKTIEGMKVGGIRQVIITAPYLSRKPLDYVIVLMDLAPLEEDAQ